MAVSVICSWIRDLICCYRCRTAPAIVPRAVSDNILSRPESHSGHDSSRAMSALSPHTGSDNISYQPESSMNTRNSPTGSMPRSEGPDTHSSTSQNPESSSTLKSQIIPMDQGPTDPRNRNSTIHAGQYPANEPPDNFLDRWMRGRKTEQTE